MNNKYISNVLIVDDVKANLISLRAILESEEVNVFEANSGNEALKILLLQKIDIILLDIQMPEMSGFEVAEILRSNSKTKSIPIIFITAINKSEEYIFKGYSLGAVDYIYKPIKNEILKSKVNVFIRLNKQAEIIKEKTHKLEEKIRELEIAEQKISKLARLDGLTGISNRRAFNEEFEKVWFGCMRNKGYLSLIMIDIDYFKPYNDTYGHLKGDECLVSIAKEIKKSISRPYDIIARYGGEEFVVLLPETHNDGAITVAEKIRRNVEKLRIEHSSSTISKYVTVSIGIATTIPTKEKNIINLLKLADDALYKAKKNGRNRVENSNSDDLLFS